MPTVYLRKDLYDRIVRMGNDPSSYVNKVVEKSLREGEKIAEDSL